MEFLFRIFTKVFGCLGLVFLTITLICPFWMKITTPQFTFTMGLWSICKNTVCTTLETYSDMFDVYRALMTICTIIGMFAVATSFVSKLRKYQLAIITNISTGMLSLIIMLLYCLWVSMTLLRDGHGFPVNVIFSWSFIIGCCGCSMFILCGFLHLYIEVKTLTRIRPRSRLKLVTRSQEVSTLRAINRKQTRSALV